MIQTKRYPLFIFLLLTGGLFSLVYLFLGNAEVTQEREASNSNTLRENYSVPIIEDDWIKESIGPGREKWHDGVRGINSENPVHLYKEIVFDSGQIHLEKDAFHFEFSDSIQYRLLLYHEYVLGNALLERTRNELIIYQPRKFPPSYSKGLSTEEADSVLQVWQIKI